MREWLIQLQQNEQVLYVDSLYSLSKCQILHPGEKAAWRDGILVITPKRVTIYQPFVAQLTAEFSFSPAEIQGYWRPEKYTSDVNEIWIHVQMGSLWRILKIRLPMSQMAALVRSLKFITTEAQIKAYRRQRPYIHRDPTLAFPARQNLQGAWILDEPLQLYLMPLALVIFHNNQVERVIPLHEIQQIAALPRLDVDDGGGLLRFWVIPTEETLAFALKHYEAWANDVAQAAKRSLEEPVIRKQKSYDDLDDE